MSRLAVVLSFVLLLACPPVWGEVRLRLQGSNTVGAALAPALVEAWLKEQGFPEVERRQQGDALVIRGQGGTAEAIVVSIVAHGSSTAFSGLLKGEADLGMASRPIKGKERDELAVYGDMTAVGSEYVIALDGIAVIVHPQNPLTSLDKATLSDLFTGKLRDWKGLGGSGAVHIYARDDHSGTYDTFSSLVLGKAELTAGAQRFDSNHALAEAVAADPQGIGFVSLAEVGGNRALAIRDAEGATLSPSAFSVATEDYALARRLFFYVPREGLPQAHALARFATSAAGQVVVMSEGLVGQQVLHARPALADEAPSEYRQLVDGAARYSINFRFNEGKVALDNKAQDDIQRLVEYVRSNNLRSHELILAGFADRHEALPLYSLDLSIQRADQVADQLIAEGLLNIRVRGYGSALPVASNEIAQGRSKNRRVEVWVR